MTPGIFLRTAVEPALSLLPVMMDGAEAQGMLIAVALQESGLRKRFQVGGTAHSFAQFEKVGINGVLTHPASGYKASEFCRMLDFSTGVDEVYDAIAYSDILCAGFSRLLLWTLKDSLPGPNEPEKGWDLYIAGWKPGRPRRENWNDHYATAWAAVLHGRVIPPETTV